MNMESAIELHDPEPQRPASHLATASSKLPWTLGAWPTIKNQGTGGIVGHGLLQEVKSPGRGTMWKTRRTAKKGLCTGESQLLDHGGIGRSTTHSRR